MQYFLTGLTLSLVQDLRIEVIESIRSKNLPEAIKNDLQIEFSVWLDGRTKALYQTGVSLPTDLPISTGVVNNGDIFTA